MDRGRYINDSTTLDWSSMIRATCNRDKSYPRLGLIRIEAIHTQSYVHMISFAL